MVCYVFRLGIMMKRFHNAVLELNSIKAWDSTSSGRSCIDLF